MQMESCVQDGKTVAVITGTELVLTDAQSALDLIMTRAMIRTQPHRNRKSCGCASGACGCVICV